MFLLSLNEVPWETKEDKKRLLSHIGLPAVTDRAPTIQIAPLELAQR